MCKKEKKNPKTVQTLSSEDECQRGALSMYGCRKAFSQSSSPTDPQRTPTGEKPYKCSVCTSFTNNFLFIIRECIQVRDLIKFNECEKAFNDCLSSIKYQRKL